MTDFEEGLLTGQLQLTVSVREILTSDVPNKVEVCLDFLERLREELKGQQSKGDKDE